MSEYRFKAGDLQPNTRVVTLEDFNVMYDRALAAEAEIERLREALRAVKKEWPHTPPRDCYATGPRTGDPIQDYVACPGCALQRKIEAALAASPETETKEGK